MLTHYLLPLLLKMHSHALIKVSSGLEEKLSQATTQTWLTLEWTSSDSYHNWDIQKTQGVIYLFLNVLESEEKP